MSIGNSSRRAWMIACRGNAIGGGLLFWSGIIEVSFGDGGCLSNLALKFILCDIGEYKKKIITSIVFLRVF